METTQTATPITEQHTLSRLFRRAWTILFKESWGKGRISRGEYWVALLMFGVVTTALNIVLLLTPPNVASVIAGVVQLWGLTYIFRRCHDLGKSGWYVGLPALLLLGLILIYIIFVVQNTSGSVLDIGMSTRVVFGVIALVLLIWLIVVGLRIAFAKGTVGPNQYGEDRLPQQPVGNGLYRGVSILLIIVTTLLSLFLPSVESPLTDLSAANPFMPPEMNEVMQQQINGSLQQDDTAVQ